MCVLEYCSLSLYFWRNVMMICRKLRYYNIERVKRVTLVMSIEIFGILNTSSQYACAQYVASSTIKWRKLTIMVVQATSLNVLLHGVKYKLPSNRLAYNPIPSPSPSPSPSPIGHFLERYTTRSCSVSMIYSSDISDFLVITK